MSQHDTHPDLDPHNPELGAAEATSGDFLTHDEVAALLYGVVRADPVASLEDQPLCGEVLVEKYAKGAEQTKEAIWSRVATALAAAETSDHAIWKAYYLDALRRGFIPAGRINSAAGTGLTATLLNCFAQPIGDSISDEVDGKPGIYTALTQAAETMRRGGGVGYDFSSIRPKGALVKGTQSSASGPVSYMRVFDRSCETVESAGARRGAQLSVLRCDHPDIEDYIHAKDKGELTNFNMSIGVSDAFMLAVEQDATVELVHKAEPSADSKAKGAYQRDDGMWVYRKVRARELWDQVMKSTYDHAEPGILFLDTINRDNNLHYCETIETTNPCVTGDTRIFTQHGIVTVKELYDAEVEVAATVDPRVCTPAAAGLAAIRHATKVFQTSPMAEVFKVTTEAGYSITATAWHKFHVGESGEFVKLADLRIGQQLWVLSAPGQFGVYGNDPLNLNLARLAGERLAPVPDSVWQGTREVVAAYTLAAFEAAGVLHKPADAEPVLRLAVTTFDEQVAIDLQVLLTNFGIFSRRSTDGEHALLEISAAYLGDFIRHVGVPSCIEASEAAAFLAAPAGARTVMDPVVSIQSDGFEPVYDVTQPDGNSVVFNGLATGQCAEQPLPSYGCCCLGSLDLTKFVVNPFGLTADGEPSFDFTAFEQVARTGVRMLDNVLDLSSWPLPQQAEEARNKRRIGIGVTGLGDALIMLKLHYGSQAARDMAARIFDCLRDSCYLASAELARERGAFPQFDVDQYLSGESFASRLPEDVKAAIREHGLRNSHLLSVAPTGTISLAFADNASNGVEPPFSWTYTRKKRMPDGTKREYQVEDHAWRLYRHLGGDVDNLPDYFVTALELSVDQHREMLAVAASRVDAAVSKTVNVPEDYPFEEFQHVYMDAWKDGIKGVATYRPNSTLGAVLSVKKEEPKPEEPAAAPRAIELPESDRRLALAGVATPVLASLKHPVRPELAQGASAWVSGNIAHPAGEFCVTVSEVNNHPFEVWVNGEEPPRGLAAVAKVLSLDMHTGDKSWLGMKLKMLARTNGDAFHAKLPGSEEQTYLPSAVAAMARLVQYRAEGMGALKLKKGEPTPVVSALLAPREPKTSLDGTLGWVVDLENPTTNDDLVLMTKELVMPDGQARPYSMWLAGSYPRALDGLAKLLSVDMRVVDPAWIGMKLRKLLTYQEARGDFLGKDPVTGKGRNYPSTVAYIARMLIHRYAMLGILTQDGYPVKPMGIVAEHDQKTKPSYKEVKVAGEICGECGAAAVFKTGGCKACSACGWLGSCG